MENSVILIENAPLNLAILLNLYNIFGFFPIIMDKYGRLFIRTGIISRGLFVLCGSVNMMGYFCHVVKQLNFWKTANPASILKTFLAILWTFSCFEYARVVLKKPQKVLEYFNIIKEASYSFNHHRQHGSPCTSRYLVLGIFSVTWYLPVAFLIADVRSKVFSFRLNTENDEIKCPIRVISYQNESLNIIALFLDLFWRTILEPFSSLVMYTTESIPLILSFCMWDVANSFSELVNRYKITINSDNNGAVVILTAYEKLKHISNLQNEIFGRIIWTNIASATLYAAETVTKIAVSQEKFDLQKTFTITYILIMTLLTLYLGAEATVKVQTLIIVLCLDKIQASMKGWLSKENVLENLSNNKLTLLLNELSTHSVGIKGGNYFTMTHHFLMKVIGSIITYFIIIYQFQSKDIYQS